MSGLVSVIKAPLNGVIGLVNSAISGNRELIENTEIKLDSLPQSVQEEIQKGVVVDTQDDAYSRLESFGS